MTRTTCRSYYVHHMTQLHKHGELDRKEGKGKEGGNVLAQKELRKSGKLELFI